MALAASPDQPRSPAPKHVRDPSPLPLASVCARLVLVCPRFGGVLGGFCGCGCGWEDAGTGWRSLACGCAAGDAAPFWVVPGLGFGGDWGRMREPGLGCNGLRWF